MGATGRPEPHRYGQIRSTGRQGRIIDDLDAFFVNVNKGLDNIATIKDAINGEDGIKATMATKADLAAMEARILSAIKPSFHLDDADELTVSE